MQFRPLLLLVSAAAAAPSESTISGRVVDAESGRVMPATVAIRAIADTAGSKTPGAAPARTAPPLTDHPSFRGGFRSSGVFEKTVAPGRVSITVSRGFDYIAQTKEVTLAPGARLSIQFRLRRRSPLHRLGWYTGDSHVHMIHGERTIEVDFDYVALAARSEGLDYLSLGHHWNIENPAPERLEEACRRASAPDFRMTWNLEAPKNYWRGNAGQCAGHGWTVGMRGRTADGRDVIAELLSMSAWDYESDKPSVPNFEIQDFIHSAGGITAYTHPHRWWWGKWGGRGGYPVQEKMRISNMAAELPFDTVAGPTYDAVDIMMQPRERETNRRALELWFMLLNHCYRIAATGSSDTTFDNPGGGVPGKTRVYTRVDGEPAFEAIAKAMKAGRNFVTSGPLVRLTIGGREVGDIVRAEPGKTLPAKIDAWDDALAKIELIRNGEVIRTWDANGDAFTGTADIRADATAWYVARVYGRDPDHIAITNPIYFEAPDYRAAQPAQARVTGAIRDSGAGTALDGVIEVIRMDGHIPVKVSEFPAPGGRFDITVPATARLRARAPGFIPELKSIFMDYAPLVDSMLSMTPERISDWATYEKIRRDLEQVRLDFSLRRE